MSGPAPSGEHGPVAKVAGVAIGGALLWGLNALSTVLGWSTPPMRELTIIPGPFGGDKSYTIIDLDPDCEEESDTVRVLEGHHVPHFSGAEVKILFADDTWQYSSESLRPNVPLKGNPSVYVWDYTSYLAKYTGENQQVTISLH